MKTTKLAATDETFGREDKYAIWAVIGWLILCGRRHLSNATLGLSPASRNLGKRMTG